MADHRARKDLGQHFLVDANIIASIVRAIAPTPNDQLVEIGPGLGALTSALLPHCDHLDVIEIDQDVIAPLTERCAKLGTLRIHHHDVLTFDFAKLASPFRLVGNLPYNISSPLLFHVFRYLDHIIDMHFMLQKEVVNRMVATPGNKTYGRLSVMVQYYCQVEKILTVKPGAFKPPPKVDSAVVRMIPHSAEKRQAIDEQLLSLLVKTAFTQRRKTLRNALLTIATEEKMIEAGIDPNARAETVTVAQYVALANRLISS